MNYSYPPPPQASPTYLRKDNVELLAIANGLLQRHIVRLHSAVLVANARKVIGLGQKRLTQLALALLAFGVLQRLVERCELGIVGSLELGLLGKGKKEMQSLSRSQQNNNNHNHNHKK